MSAFFSPYRHQFVRIAACVPQVAIAEPVKNADQALALVAAGDKEGVALMVFPELCLSAYAIDDLLFQDAVLEAVTVAVDRLVAASKKLAPVFVVGESRQRGGLRETVHVERLSRFLQHLNQLGARDAVTNAQTGESKNFGERPHQQNIWALAGANFGNEIRRVVQELDIGLVHHKQHVRGNLAGEFQQLSF